MAKNINSAARLLSILNRVQSCSDQPRVIDIWATLFDIKEANTHKKAISVSETINVMYKELQLTTISLSSTNLSKDLYEAAFSRIENALSPILFSHQWSTVKQLIGPEVITALSFCVEILPDEESQISNEELNAIRDCVNELQSVLTDAEIPIRLRTLIEHHIDLIENALSEYKIVGAKAFREAGRTALGEMIEAKDEISQAKDSQVVAKLKKTWSKVNIVTDAALKTEKLTQLGQKIWGFIETNLPNIF